MTNTIKELKKLLPLNAEIVAIGTDRIVYFWQGQLMGIDMLSLEK